MADLEFRIADRLLVEVARDFEIHLAVFDQDEE